MTITEKRSFGNLKIMYSSGICTKYYSVLCILHGEQKSTVFYVYGGSNGSAFTKTT